MPARRARGGIVRFRHRINYAGIEATGSGYETPATEQRHAGRNCNRDTIHWRATRYIFDARD
jgi:hypothetical protein